jgi:hypothetical protein
MPQSNDGPTVTEQVVLAAVVAGMTFAIIMWIMLEHDQEVRAIFRNVFKRIDQWAQ